MRPIFAKKMLTQLTISLLSPYVASTLVDFGASGYGAGFFDAFTNGGPAAVQFGSKIYYTVTGNIY